MKMDYKEVMLGQEPKQLIKEGINDLAEAVLITMGPEGKTMIIPDENGEPKVTKDGVSVALATGFNDPIKNVGAKIIKKVAKKTLEEAGDGTTTAICIANSLINEGFKLIEEGESPNQVKKFIINLEHLVANRMYDNVYEVKGDDIQNVASIAANNDRSIGKIIQEAYKHSNVVKVERGHDTNHKVKLIEGMELLSGILDYAFINDETSQAIIYEDARVIIIDGHLKSLKPIAPLIKSLDIDEPLIIIADEVADSVTRILRDNFNKGALKVGIIKSPGHAQHRANLIEDLKVALIPKGEQMGYIKSIKATPDKSIISFKRTKAIEGKLAGLKGLMNNTFELYEKELLQQRIDILEGDVAVIQVGGSSDLEIIEAYDRIEDAVLATRCAIEQGVVNGAGAYLSNIADELGEVPFAKCLYSPANQIKVNGWEGLPKGDYYEQGIIDPVKVTYTAFLNATSVAKTVLGIAGLIH